MKKANYNKQDLRHFLQQYEAENPSRVVRITEPVGMDYDCTAIAFEMERRKLSPLLIFENVQGSRFPVLMNLYSARDRFAAAIGCAPGELIEKWAALDAQPIKPKLLSYSKPAPFWMS
ncbi:MAG: UbiD family decarboxylase [Proteobacteria bacterium]|nr:UbiD family decarboxylase [Pseudomonadota bacterium]